MTESKRVADKLREWFERYTLRKDVYDELTAIADRIDAEHEEAIQREHESAYDAGYAEGSGAGLATVALGSARWMDKHEDAMAEHGWVRLLKDIDGKYIYEHDKVDWRDHAGTWHENATVIAMCSDGCYVMDSTVFFHVHKSDIRHHKPTVEGLLCELLDKVDDDRAGQDEIIAEYAKRLRLAGDAE